MPSMPLPMSGSALIACSKRPPKSALAPPSPPRPTVGPMSVEPMLNAGVDPFACAAADWVVTATHTTAASNFEALLLRVRRIVILLAKGRRTAERLQVQARGRLGAR